MGAGGFEPPNANARGFTIPALWPLGYTPVSIARTIWDRPKSHLSDSNRGPADYKSAALSTELRWRYLMSSHALASEPRNFEMGYTGLEPVTPSVSYWCASQLRQ